MAQSATASFAAAEKADVNKPISKVQLVLGNYASASGYGSSASASGSDSSGNYPPSGAIDDDRTEINVGAASSADNGVGLSSWRADANPSQAAPNTLTVDFGQKRTFNRIKLYHLSSHALSSFMFQYWNADSLQWVPFLVTSDLTSSYAGGWGGFPWGTGPWGTGTTAPASFTTTNKLDTIDFSDVTASKIQLVVYACVAVEPANVVELEVYRKIDITSRCISVETDRQRDYKQKNNISSTAHVEVENYDQFFSPDYVPTSSQTSTFINSELRSSIGLLVQFGFDYGGTTEYLYSFTGTLDTLSIKSKSRTARIEGRDNTKFLIDQILNSNLKTSQDIKACLQYTLNLCNISNYEMSLDSTTITLDYFFIYATSAQTIIQNLVQASGDAQFYFDESGTATFKMYLNQVPQSQADTTQANFQTGTVLTNIDTDSQVNRFQRQWYKIDDFADGDITKNPVWTVNSGSGNITVSANLLTISSLGGGADIQTPVGFSNFNQGCVQWKMAIPNSNVAKIRLVQSGSSGSYYEAVINGNGSLTIGDNNGSGGNANTWNNDGLQHVWGFKINNTGGIYLYVDGTQFASFGATNAYLGSNFYIEIIILLGTGNITFTNIYGTYSYLSDPSSPAAANTQAVFESRSFDMTTSVVSLGTLQAVLTQPSGTSVAWYSAVSSDNSIWDAYVAVVNNANMTSAVKRYIKYKAVLTCPVDNSAQNNNFNSPLIFSVTLNYFTGSGSQKYHPSPDFTMKASDVLLDITEDISDNMGGDAAVLNDVIVQSSPLILTGADTDTQWQGTTGAPAVAVSASNPLSISTGHTKFTCIISGGMDTSKMSGASPAAAVVTAGTATFTYTITYINPTIPVLDINCTVAGTVTDLRLIGKHYANTINGFTQEVKNSKSIALYGKKSLTISNNFIITSAVASSIATSLVANYKNPINILRPYQAQPAYRIQIGDTVTIADPNSTAISAQYWITGVKQNLSSREAHTEVTGIRILN